MDFEIEEQEPPASKAEPVSGNRSAPGGTPSRLAADRVLARWRFLRWTLRFCLYVGLALYVSGKYVIGRFDEKLQIAKSVRTDPVQEAISEAPFFFSYGKDEYRIEPVASYDISGLIVTHNEVSSMTDAYHTSESVDFRDLCLVWGSNVGSGVFRRMTFWSEPWSCHTKANDQDAAMSFNPQQLSNNHLLSADPQVRKTIRSMQIGDQVRLQGMLIDYSPKWSPEQERKTSLIRDDTGNGACEVLWVESAQILKRGGTGWHFTRDVGFWLLVAAIVGGAVVFLAAPVNLYRG
jgi:hypothetical protein